MAKCRCSDRCVCKQDSPLKKWLFPPVYCSRKFVKEDKEIVTAEDIIKWAKSVPKDATVRPMVDTRESSSGLGITYPDMNKCFGVIFYWEEER